MNYRAFDELGAVIRLNVRKIPKDVDLVVGVPQGGLLAASLVALHLNLPIVDLDGFLDDESPKHGFTRRTKNEVSSTRGAGHVLVVDDGIVSGETLARAKAMITAFSSDQRVSYCAIYADPSSLSMVDVFLEELPGPHHFEWNLLRSGLLSESCIDIDGVLCRDPTRSENDGDGPCYQHFIRSVPPLSLPSYEIGYLVTSRLEKYRKETEAWLHFHGIKYKKLHMLDLPDAATRRKLKAHAEHKTEIFGMYPESPLFVESSIPESIEIARRSKRPVLCFADHKVYTAEHRGPAPCKPISGHRARLLNEANKAVNFLTEVRISQLRRRPMQYRSFSDLARSVVTNHHKIPRDVDLIVGIPRSGMLAGCLISLLRDIPLVDVEGFVGNRTQRFVSAASRRDSMPPQSAKHVLLVDDTVFGGKSMKEALKQVLDASPAQRVTSCAIYVHPKRAHLVDVHFEKLESPGCQEWNFLHRDKAESFCLELEGVLCQHPNGEERSDDRTYRQSIRSLEPLYLPSHQIGWIVTSRDESYRRETEEWLNSHGIVYKQLYMMKHAEAEVDPRAEIKFKARVYKSHRDSLMFIDSSPGIAKGISKASGKTALAFGTQEVFIPEISFEYLRLRAKRFRNRLSHRLRRGAAHKQRSAVNHSEV